MKPRDLFVSQGPAACLVWEDLARSLHTHSPSFHRRPRQSRGLRCRRDDFFPARSHSRESSCDSPWSEIEMRPIESLLPMTQLRVPVPHLFPAQRHRFFIGRVLDGGPPTETEDESASRRSASLWRTAHASWGRCLPPTRLRDRTSDTSVATLTRYRCAPLSRCAFRFTDSARAAKTASTPPS